MTVNEVLDILKGNRSDNSFKYKDTVFVLYMDETQVTADTDDGLNYFKNWEELLKSDCFNGKKLGDIVEDLVPIY